MGLPTIQKMFEYLPVIFQRERTEGIKVHLNYESKHFYHYDSRFSYNPNAQEVSCYNKNASIISQDSCQHPSRKSLYGLQVHTLTSMCQLYPP
jgi:hypothetical protein